MEPQHVEVPIQVTSVIVWVTPLLIALIGYFLKSWIGGVKTSIDDNRSKTEGLEKSWAGTDKEIALMKKDVEHLTKSSASLDLELRSLRDTRDDVAVLKRDQATIWKKIDEIKQGKQH